MGFLEDLRRGLRALAKSPSVAVVAMLSLALGIGANTTIFTLVNAVLLRPLPVSEPSRLVALHTIDPRYPGLQFLSYPNYRDYRDHNSVFSSLVLYSSITVNLTGQSEPKLLMGQIVTGNYFNALGVSPVVGRGFLPEEDATAGALPVAVLSYRFWAREFGSDPRITTRTIQLNGRPFRVVGVAPPGFDGLAEMYAADVWVPMMMYREVFPAVAWVNQRRALVFQVFGRLKPGVTRAQAETNLEIIAEELEREYPADNAGRRVKLTSVSEAALAAKTRTLVTNAGAMLLVISGLVLLIACANVANLLLVRASGRSKEITVRLALGAGRWRLIRQLLAESVILSLAGGLVGLLVARWARDALWSLRPPMFRYAGVHLDLDGRVLGYAFAVSLLTGILFGLIPALRATQSDLARDLKERTGKAAFSGRGWNPRSVLVSGQVAFALVALVVAGLFIRSIASAMRIDPGFDAAHLSFVMFNVGEQGYSEARGREYQDRALEAARGTPGVISASLAKDAPFHVSSSRTVMLEGQENTASGAGRITLTSVVWPDYFGTVGIPLERGREFSALDTGTGPRVAVVNQSAAEHFWPGQNPIGQRLYFFGDKAPVDVVGVARNASYLAIGEEPQPLIYLSLKQYYFPTAVVYVRTPGDPDQAAEAVRRALQPLDRNLVLQPDTAGRTIGQSLWAQQLSAGLLTVFGGLALLLSTIGIYGVVSYSVNQRSREIGVRMALGATARDVQLMVLRDGIRLVALGVTAGMAVALLASRVVQSMLFAVSAQDAVTFVLVPSFLALVAVVACWIPARRATRIDPATALRDE